MSDRVARWSSSGHELEHNPSAHRAVVSAVTASLARAPVAPQIYLTRAVAPASSASQQLTAAELGLATGAAYFVSVAAVDAAGHESLFGYPEYRCDSTACSVQAGSLDTTALN